LCDELTTRWAHRRLGATSAKQMTEKALKYYPLSIHYSGNLTAKSSYLVRIVLTFLTLYRNTNADLIVSAAT
jgi:hypothetical protein